MDVSNPTDHNDQTVIQEPFIFFASTNRLYSATQWLGQAVDANFLSLETAQIISLVASVLTRSRVKILLLLKEQKVFHKLSHVVPAIVIQNLPQGFLGKTQL